MLRFSVKKCSTGLAGNLGAPSTCQCFFGDETSVGIVPLFLQKFKIGPLLESARIVSKRSHKMKHTLKNCAVCILVCGTCESFSGAFDLPGELPAFASY